MSRWIQAWGMVLLAGHDAAAGPLSFDVLLDVPPVIADSRAPRICTVTYIIADVINSDLYAARMQIEPTRMDTPVANRLPCPSAMPPRIGLSALDVCNTRTSEAKSCVFADIGRLLDRQADLHNTAENASRCASYKATDIGMACWMSSQTAICNVACGTSPNEAVVQARARFAGKQQQSCPITATSPVAAP